ncbi:MAG: agmatinase [Candidatus Zixiibacteriota bacterium]|nr:MAG: agmatinase [candidate division Zixibacteria bacterium]
MIIPANPRYLSSRPDSAGCVWRLVGLPYDGAVSYRGGARFAPTEIRLASDSIESYSPYQDRDLEDHPFCDLGDLDLGRRSPDQAVAAIRDHYAEQTRAGAKILALGGDHTVTVGVLQGLVQAGKQFTLLHLDAHLDLRPEYTGGIYSHACIARRAVELLGPERVIQWGQRSGERSEFRWAREQGLYRGRDPERLMEILQDLRSQSVYLTLDLDVFDPAEMPGVGTPEPGGWRFSDFLAVLPEIQALDLAGMDVVELAPNLDPSGRSSVVAAEIVRELLLAAS